MAKTYAEYLAEDRKRPPSKHLAPLTARPKYSKGDNPKAREIEKNSLRKGYVTVSQIPITKDGLINTRKMRPIRQKIYKIQEAGHGR